MKRFLLKLLHFLPTKLPIGVIAFQEWSDEILFVYDMPNNDSMKFAIATQILHLNSTDGYKPKRYFGLTLIKGAASQIAHSIMMECKAKQEAKALQEKFALEDAAAQALLAATFPTETPLGSMADNVG